MKITAIKQQVKRADRFSVYVDLKYSFSLTSEELLNSKIHVGLEINDTQLRDLKNLSENSLVILKCYNYLSYRLRSTWEMETYLKRKGYSAQIISETIKYLADRKLIDDLEFANRWIDNRLLLKPTSINILRLELKQKRIKLEIINQAIASHEIDELEVINQVITKKRQQSKYLDNLKLMQFLARKGFSYDLIKQALNSSDD
jgi:regulatory protein